MCGSSAGAGAPDPDPSSTGSSGTCSVDVQAGLSGPLTSHPGRDTLDFAAGRSSRPVGFQELQRLAERRDRYRGREPKQERYHRVLQRWKVLHLPLAVILVPAAYQVFAVFLRVPLPRGLFGW